MVFMVTKESTTMVKPASKTPNNAVWLSNLDLMSSNSPVPVVYLYHNITQTKFVDIINMVKEALSRVLVPYYPIAGRFRLNTGRIEIDCCGKGVGFTVAVANFSVKDLRDDLFAPTSLLKELAPLVDRSGGLSSFPLLAIQITSFKCGGVSLGLTTEHRLCDGISAVDFINEWSKLTRDLNHIPSLPLIDRTFLKARNPPRPEFDHSIEYQPTLILENEETHKDIKPNNTSNIIVKSFKFEEKQLLALKKSLFQVNDYSMHEILLGHIWKCTCMARNDDSSSLFDHDVDTKLYIATSGRSRLVDPPCPRNLYGNVIFATSPIAGVRDIVSKPTIWAVDRIREALAKMKDEKYLRSAIDYLEGLSPSLSERGGRGSVVYRSPNLGINSWVRMPTYTIDFGFGRPFFVGPAEISTEGKVYLLPDGSDDKNLNLVIALKPEDMARFEKLIYEW